MFKNYFKIALRTLRRKSLYSIINIIGLSTGLVCIVFIFNWVGDELGYDKHFPNNKNIYKVMAEAGTGDERWHQSVTSLPLSTTLKNTYPEVVDQVRFRKHDAMVIRGDNQYIEDFIVMTDPSFFNVFDYDLIVGDTATALKDPYKIVLTETMAKKYFGNENPVGQSLKLFIYDSDGNGIDFEITGVIKDPLETSHFSFNILGSMATLASIAPEEMHNWTNNSYHSYIVLKDGVNPASLEIKLPDMVDQHLGEVIDAYDLYFRFYFTPITDIHLYSDAQYEFRSNGSVEYVWIFSSIGFFILLLAGINYINLSTSFSLDRVKEMGVRKSLGAFRSQLVWQHLTETFVLSVAAMLLAGLLIELFKPVFYELTGKYHLEFNKLNLSFQLVILTLPLALISGYIPARFLAKVNTISSLKGKVQTNPKNRLRMGLVTFQFVVTLAILSGLFVIRQQLEFVQSQDLGYDKSNLLILKTNGSDEVNQHFERFKTQLMSSANTISIARSGSRIGNGLGNSSAQFKDEKGESHFLKTYRLPIDYGYLETYQMQLVAGRDLDFNRQGDSTQSFLVNEAFVKSMGWSPEDALNKVISFNGREGEIIGVVKDFNFASLHQPVAPVCMWRRQSNFSRITIRGKENTKLLKETLEAWKSTFPHSIFDHTFQDQALFENYNTDYRFGKVFNVFSTLSLIIAFLGLFGLIGYNVKRKTKEIGIRKALGATTTQILQLISSRFIMLILIASAISIPISWAMMENWLSSYTYRITLSIWPFIMTTTLILAAALIIIVIQSFKPSRINPADSLKQE
ncbi:MAG: FtsX-like permease family protein [Fulvivirga sp.]